MNLVEIDGKVYDVIVVSIERSAEIRQSENAGATLAEGAEETLDPIGTFITHTVTFRRRHGHESEFDALWDCVTKSYLTGVWVNVVYNQTTLKYKAKFSVYPQGVQRIDKNTGKVYWNDLVVSLIPTKAQVTP